MDGCCTKGIEQLLACEDHSPVASSMPSKAKLLLLLAASEALTLQFCEGW